MLLNRKFSNPHPSTNQNNQKLKKNKIWELTVHVIHIMFACKDIEMFVIICIKQLDNQLRKHWAVYDLQSMQDIKIHITSRFTFLIKHSMMPVALLAPLVNKTLLLFVSFQPSQNLSLHLSMEKVQPGSSRLKFIICPIYMMQP